jgi:hypothetical protein
MATTSTPVDGLTITVSDGPHIATVVTAFGT